MSAFSVELCRTCDQPFCWQCDDTALPCVAGGWHCGECGPAGCDACGEDQADEWAGMVAEDVEATDG